MSTVPITRRAAIVAGCAVVGSARARAAPAVAATAETVDVNGESVKVARHVASGAGPRSTVLILHGSKGLDAHLPAYERYADDLAIAGMDALVFSYYGPGDLSAIDDASSASKREALYARSIGRWMSVVRTVAKSAKERNPSARVGLLGFSLGGFVAVAAASEPLFSVLTTFYAGLPTFYDRPISFLPPLLDIHGDADRAVPLCQGMKLVVAAKNLGGVADLAVFRNEGHGFDLDPRNPDALRARQRAIAFSARWLVRS